MSKHTVSFTLNGNPVRQEVDITATLLDMIRDEIGLTGTKKGCEIGECGACTVVMDGRAVNACLVLAPQSENADVWTVEGLNRNGELDVLQKSFIQEHAVHCGFCTPGMLMSSRALLQDNPDPTEEEIRVAISGNLCRCTGYTPIVRGIRRAAEQLKNQ